jgi:SAM-dependent methyltransferase
MASGAGSSGQADLWGADVDNWAGIQEKAVRPLYEAAFRTLSVGPGISLLDAGCGAGLALTIAAAEGATVSGFDASEQMLAFARRRLPDAELRLGDLETIPWGDGVFDVVTGFNSFQFAATPLNALLEAKRVTRPGGRVVVATWGPAEQCDATAYVRAMGSLLPPPPQPGTPGPFALSAPGALDALVREAGLSPLADNYVDCPFEYDDLETALRGLLSAGGAIRAVQSLGRAAVHDAVTKALEPYRTASGGVRMANVFHFIVACA